MKSFKLFLLIAMSFIFVVSAQAQATDGKKMGYLDLSRVFDGYVKTKQYDTAMEAQHKDFEKERNAKIEKLREIQQKFDLAKEAEKTKIQDDLNKMQTELIEYDRQKKMDLTKDRDEKIREILLEIEKVVSDWAKAQGYGLIFNDKVLIYGDKAVYDITDPILQILNDNYSKTKK